jgi:ketosteroid isomerase-like protein
MIPVVDHATAKALLARLHEAQNAMYAGGDLGAVRALLTSDILWHVPGNNAIAGVYRGIDETLEYFRWRREVTDGTMQLHPGELLVGERDHVAVLTDGTAKIAGTEYRWSTIGLYRFKESLIAACWLLPLDQAVFDQVWSLAERPATPPSASAPPGSE